MVGLHLFVFILIISSAFNMAVASQVNMESWSICLYLYSLLSGVWSMDAVNVADP